MEASPMSNMDGTRLLSKLLPFWTCISTYFRHVKIAKVCKEFGSIKNVFKRNDLKPNAVVVFHSNSHDYYNYNILQYKKEVSTYIKNFVTLLIKRGTY